MMSASAKFAMMLCNQKQVTHMSMRYRMGLWKAEIHMFI